MCNQSVWYELLKFYRDNCLIFRGPVDNLQVYNCWLKEPQTFGDAKGTRLESNYHIKLEMDDEEKEGERKEILYKIKFFG